MKGDLRTNGATKRPLSGVERQRRYRLTRELVSIDISRATAERLQALRRRMGSPADQVVAAAIEALTSVLDEVGRVRPPAKPPKRERHYLRSKPDGNIAPAKTQARKSPGDDMTASRKQETHRGRAKRKTKQPVGQKDLFIP